MGNLVDRPLQWYTRLDKHGVEQGPFERAALIDAVRRGQLSRRVKVRREDQVKWSTLERHSAFRAGLTGWRPGESQADESPGESELDEIPGVPHSPPAGPGLWLLAVFVYVIHVVLVSSNGTTNWGTRVLGAMFGALLWPLLIVGIASLWRSNRTQRMWVKVFVGASVWLVVLRLVLAYVLVR